MRQPIAADQFQLSITPARSLPRASRRNMLAQDRSISRDGGGGVDYCRPHDITSQASSPLQGGFFTGVFFGTPDCPELNAVIDRPAAAYDVPPIAIATAWITRHPAQMQVVLGTTSPDRVAAAALGSELQFARPEWHELLQAAGHMLP